MCSSQLVEQESCYTGWSITSSQNATNRYGKTVILDKEQDEIIKIRTLHLKNFSSRTKFYFFSPFFDYVISLFLTFSWTFVVDHLY